MDKVTIESKRPEDLPDWEEREARRKQFDANSDWLEEHRAELAGQYPDQWVLVHDGQVVAHDPDLDEVFRKLKTGPVASEPVAHWFFSSKPITLIV